MVGALELWNSWLPDLPPILGNVPHFSFSPQNPQNRQDMMKRLKCMLCVFSPSWPNHSMYTQEQWVLQHPSTPPQPPVPFACHGMLGNGESKSKCLKSMFFAAITSWAHHGVLSHKQRVREHLSTPPHPSVPFTHHGTMENCKMKSKCRTRMKWLGNVCINSSSSTHSIHHHMTDWKLSCWRPLRGHRIY